MLKTDGHKVDTKKELDKNSELINKVVAFQEKIKDAFKAEVLDAFKKEYPKSDGKTREEMYSKYSAQGLSTFIIVNKYSSKQIDTILNQLSPKISSTVKDSLKSAFTKLIDIYIDTEKLKQAITTIPDAPYGYENSEEWTLANNATDLVSAVNQTYTIQDKNEIKEIKDALSKIFDETKKISSWSKDFLDEYKANNDQLNEQLKKLNKLESELTQQKSILNRQKIAEDYVVDIIDNSHKFRGALEINKRISEVKDVSTSFRDEVVKLTNSVYQQIDKRNEQVFKPIISACNFSITKDITQRKNITEAEILRNGLNNLLEGRPNAVTGMINEVDVVKKSIESNQKILEDKKKNYEKILKVKAILADLKSIEKSINELEKQLEEKAKKCEYAREVEVKLSSYKVALNDKNKEVVAIFTENFKEKDVADKGLKPAEELDRINNLISKMEKNVESYHGFLNVINTYPDQIDKASDIGELNNLLNGLEKMSKPLVYDASSEGIFNAAIIPLYALIRAKMYRVGLSRLEQFLKNMLDCIKDKKFNMVEANSKQFNSSASFLGNFEAPSEELREYFDKIKKLKICLDGYAVFVKMDLGIMEEGKSEIPVKSTDNLPEDAADLKEKSVETKQISEQISASAIKKSSEDNAEALSDMTAVAEDLGNLAEQISAKYSAYVRGDEDLNKDLEDIEKVIEQANKVSEQISASAIKNSSEDNAEALSDMMAVAEDLGNLAEQISTQGSVPVGEGEDLGKDLEEIEKAIEQADKVSEQISASAIKKSSEDNAEALSDMMAVAEDLANVKEQISAQYSPYVPDKVKAKELLAKIEADSAAKHEKAKRQKAAVVMPLVEQVQQKLGVSSEKTNKKISSENDVKQKLDIRQKLGAINKDLYELSYSLPSESPLKALADSVNQKVIERLEELYPHNRKDIKHPRLIQKIEDRNAFSEKIISLFKDAKMDLFINTKYAYLYNCIQQIKPSKGKVIVLPNQQAYIDKIQRYIDWKDHVLNSFWRKRFYREELTRDKIQLAEIFKSLLKEFNFTPHQMGAVIDFFESLNNKLEAGAKKTYHFKKSGDFSTMLNEIKEDAGKYEEYEEKGDFSYHH